MKENLRKLFTNVWNVPNALTILRMILIPVFVLLHVRGLEYPALAVFLLASFTDFLDGKIARKYHLITDFGKLFDPLADKLMVCTALICQCAANVLPWSAVLIVLAKELLMVIGGSFMLKKNIVVYSNLWGKIAQVLFIVSLTLSFFHNQFDRIGCPVHLILLWITVGMALAALIAYAVGAIRQLKNQK